MSADNGLSYHCTFLGIRLNFISRTSSLHRNMLPEQPEIVRRVEGLFALADQLEEGSIKARTAPPKPRESQEMATDP